MKFICCFIFFSCTQRFCICVRSPILRRLNVDAVFTAAFFFYFFVDRQKEGNLIFRREINQTYFAQNQTSAITLTTKTELIYSPKICPTKGRKFYFSRQNTAEKPFPNSNFICTKSKKAKQIFPFD